MTSSLSSWVDRPQLNRQHSIDKATQPSLPVPVHHLNGHHGHPVFAPTASTGTYSGQHFVGSSHNSNCFGSAQSRARPTSAGSDGSGTNKKVRSQVPELDPRSPPLSLSRRGSLSGPVLSAKNLVCSGSVDAELLKLHGTHPPPAGGNYNPTKSSKLSVVAEPALGGHGSYGLAPTASSAGPAPLPPSRAVPSGQVTTECPDANRQRGVAASVPGPDSCPPHGCKGACGQRSQMQDAHSVVQNFVHLSFEERPGVVHRWPDTLEVPPASSQQDVNESSLDADASPTLHEAFHYFGVFDGHGGQAASEYCAQMLHRHCLEALGGAAGYRFNPRQLPNAPVKEDEGESVQVVGQKGECRAGNWVSDPVCAELVESALQTAFVRTDEEVARRQVEAGVKDYAGSTAVVALVSKSLLWVGNCGDSRAVLLRGGVPLQLSSDQTAGRADEVRRIEGAGGEIYYLQDCPRVMGVLAMSRSIGDHYLHPYVIPDPEATALPRHPDDELLILGTDGLWDKLSNEYACEVSRRCLARAKAKGASRKAAAKCAATVLIRTAMQKGSRDNVTAIVVDLASEAVYAAEQPQQEAS